MRKALIVLNERLGPAEEILFSWLIRVIAAATLVGSAWIDDAPPLELGALIIAIYVAVRVAMQYSNLVEVSPFNNRALKSIFAVGALALLGLSFLTVVTFVEQLSVSAVG